MGKTPKLIHCTFTNAHIEAPLPDNVYIEVQASANQYNVSMIIWPEHFAELKALIEQMERGEVQTQPIAVKWVPLFAKEQ